LHFAFHVVGVFFTRKQKDTFTPMAKKFKPFSV